MSGTWAKAAVATRRYQRDRVAEAVNRIIERETPEEGPHHMTDLKAAAEAEKAAHKGGDLGAFSKAFCEFQRLATPDVILALYAERAAQYDENVNRIAAEGAAILRAEAAEASIASYKEEVERLRALVLEARNVVSTAEDALGSCYDVCDWPADGTTKQDIARKACELTFARLDEALTKETPDAG